jgi:hypothetical protein
MGSGRPDDRKVTPLAASRQKKAPRGRPFAPGNTESQTAALIHGAYSVRMVDELALEIKAGLLARPSCPRRLVEDPDDENLEAWAATVAICRLLRSVLTTANVEEAMTEQVVEDETMTHASTLGPGSRSLRGKRKPSVLEQLARYQTQAMNLSKVLGLDAASRRAAGEEQSATVDYAKYWAARAEHQARDAEGSAG